MDTTNDNRWAKIETALNMMVNEDVEYVFYTVLDNVIDRPLVAPMPDLAELFQLAINTVKES